MDFSLKREIDRCAASISMLTRYAQGEDEEAKEYAMLKIIENYVRRQKLGALLEMRREKGIPEKIREMSGLAIVNAVSAEKEGEGKHFRQKHGILDDLAFDRRSPERVRIAAGKKRVDILVKRIKEGDAMAKKGIEAVIAHRRHHPEVRNYARNALDALEIARERAKEVAKGGNCAGRAGKGFQKNAPRAVDKAVFVQGKGI
ncbi:MAG: hypothetical protein QXH30_01365 [Candidatus Bilamarchaeaceae archaeon]